MLLLYAILRVQPLLHMFDPAYRPGPLAADLAMNTAISFASQVVGLPSQNFLAGAAEALRLRSPPEGVAEPLLDTSLTAPAWH